jgi:predicted Fe-Mo cluster-binding NifX family protein
MKLAVTSETNRTESPVDPRFGRAKYFMICDESSGSWEWIDNQQNMDAAQGAGIQSAANVVNAGCEVLITGHCGPKAFTALQKAGVSVYTVSDCTVQNAIDLYKKGALQKLESADVQGHW